MKKIKNQHIKLKQKIYNYLMIKGNKINGEKLLLKIIKSIQKFSIKNYTDLIKLAFINAMPLIKLKKELKKKKKRKKQNAREFPSIIRKQNRIFLAIKYVLKNSINKESKSLNFYTKLKQEILFDSQNKGTLTNNKNILYELALKKKKYIYIKYRWV